MPDFDVRPFAFMRLTHEALRDGFGRLDAAIAAGDLAGARQEYQALSPVIALHARQEEAVFFPTLDRLFDGAAEKGGLRDAHEREDALQEALAAALEGADLGALAAAAAAWRVSFEEHLAHEEDVMMPLTIRVAPTLEGRAAVVRQILEVDFDALGSDLVPYVAASLARTKPFGPLRMFAAALQVASGERYGELAPALHAAVPHDTSAQLARLGH
jgi:iron-sulfur cluster repair protein YtfE (RIC family)